MKQSEIAHDDTKRINKVDINSILSTPVISSIGLDPAFEIDDWTQHELRTFTLEYKSKHQPT